MSFRSSLAGRPANEHPIPVADDDRRSGLSPSSATPYRSTSPSRVVLRQGGTPRASDDLSLCPCVPVPTGTHGKPSALADKSSLSMHGKRFQLTPRDGPHLCKAVLRPLSGATSASVARSIQNMPSPGGQDSGMADPAPSPGSVGGLGAASRRPPRGLPRGSPGTGLATPAGGEQECCPRGAA
jgi:hypothetical protein